MLTHTPFNYWTKNDRIKILWKHGATYIKYQKSLNLLFMLIQWTVLLETISFLWLFFFICRDLVHRQTSMSAIQHIALGVYGFGCEDALTHLLNYVWPNIFETSPHVVQAFMGSIEGMRVGIGPSKILQYALQVRTIKTTLFGVGERIWGGWGLEFSLKWGDPCSHGHVHNHMIILQIVNCSHSVDIQISFLWHIDKYDKCQYFTLWYEY